MKRVWLLPLPAMALMACGAAIGGGEEEQGSPDGGALVEDSECDEQDEQTWYRDFDGDGFGDSELSHQSCTQPSGYVSSSTDCNDNAIDISPDGVEVCGDKIDNDCSGSDACLDALLVHHAFDDIEGANAADATGSGHDALPRGGATMGGDMATFDGTDDYFEVAHADDFAIGSGTVALWLRTDTTAVEQGLWSKDSSGYDAGGHLTLRITAAGELGVRLQSDTTSYTLTSPVISSGTWYHLVASFGAAGLRLYVDGQLVGQSDYTGGMVANPEPIVIGALSTVSGDGVAEPISSPMDGDIADVQSYARALSDAEIAELYQLTAP